jgi:hypothetical protein
VIGEVEQQPQQLKKKKKKNTPHQPAFSHAFTNEDMPLVMIMMMGKGQTGMIRGEEKNRKQEGRETARR